jgi:hypothetical protein
MVGLVKTSVGHQADLASALAAEEVKEEEGTMLKMQTMVKIMGEDGW